MKKFIFVIILIILISLLSLVEKTYAQDLQLTNLTESNEIVIGIEGDWLFTTDGWAIDKNDILIGNSDDIKRGDIITITYYRNDIGNPNDDEFVSYRKWEYKNFNLW